MTDLCSDIIRIRGGQSRLRPPAYIKRFTVTVTPKTLFTLPPSTVGQLRTHSSNSIRIVLVTRRIGLYLPPWDGIGKGKNRLQRMMPRDESTEHCIQSTRVSVPSSELGLPPPTPQASLSPPRLGPGREATLACGVGEMRDPIPAEGQALWCSMYTIISLRK